MCKCVYDGGQPEEVEKCVCVCVCVCVREREREREREGVRGEEDRGRKDALGMDELKSYTKKS